MLQIPVHKPFFGLQHAGYMAICNKESASKSCRLRNRRYKHMQKVLVPPKSEMEVMA